MSLWVPAIGPDRHGRSIEELFDPIIEPSNDGIAGVDRTILICFTNRSGSNLLAELLATTGRMRRAREQLNREPMERQSRERGITSFSQYLQHLVESFALEGTLSVKVGLGQLVALARLGLLEGFLPDPKFVFIERNDLLAQAVSWEIARQSGQWTSQQEAVAEPTYDFAAIDARIDAIAEENALFRVFFARNGLPFSHVVYERLVADDVGEIERIGEELGIGRLEANPGLVRIDRQASGRNLDFARRYTQDRRLTGGGQVESPIDQLLEENRSLRQALEGTIDPRLFGRAPRPDPRGLKAAAKAVIPERYHPLFGKARRVLRP